MEKHISICKHCRKGFNRKWAYRKFCTNVCRQAAYRKRKAKA